MKMPKTRSQDDRIFTQFDVEHEYYDSNVSEEIED